MKITRFEDIKSWQQARELTQDIYRHTGQEKFSRDYGLKDQLQRASASIMHNIAEGFDGGSAAEFVRFLGYAQRSATEVMSGLYIALDQSYLTAEDFESLYAKAQDTHALIGGFIRYLKTAPRP
ncbi:MAG: four helix bundle protein [Verrucomicrobiota bacterium JB024]|nr:four helix bundle protein [Verrucomicrobiota bacterium JB024]